MDLGRRLRQKTTMDLGRRLRQKTTVLIVESDDSYLTSLSAMIASFNYKVYTCLSAIQALELLRDKGHELYEMVIISFELPGMDGFTLLKTISREIVNLPAVIMMDSSGSTTNCFKSMYMGACDYIVKPVKEDYVNYMYKYAVKMKKERYNEEAKLVGLPIYIAPQRKVITRFVWTEDLKNSFTKALNNVGGFKKATPTKVLKEMQKIGIGICKDLNAKHVGRYLHKCKKANASKEATSTSVVQENATDASSTTTCV